MSGDPPAMAAHAPDSPIPLIPEEQKLFDRIQFDLRNSQDSAESRAAAVELAHSLLDRGAVPDARRRYVMDPELNVGGRGSSIVERLEQHGLAGDELLGSPAFRKHLKYMILGPNLPASTVRGFRKILVDDMGTSGMILDQLQAFSRAEARRWSQQERSQLHEEFYKLALECEVDQHVARCVRDAVRGVR